MCVFICVFVYTCKSIQTKGPLRVELCSYKIYKELSLLKQKTSRSNTTGFSVPIVIKKRHKHFRRQGLSIY